MKPNDGLVNFLVGFSTSLLGGFLLFQIALPLIPLLGCVREPSLFGGVTIPPAPVPAIDPPTPDSDGRDWEGVIAALSSSAAIVIWRVWSHRKKK